MSPTLKKKIVFDVSRLGIVQVSNVAVPLITLPYLVYALGATQFGVLVTSISIVSVLNLLVQWGFELSSSREVSRNRETPWLTSQFFWDYFNAKLILFSITVTAFYLICMSLKIDNEIIALTKYSLVIIIANLLNPVWYFNAINHLDKIYIHSSLIRYIQIPLTFFFVNGPEDIVAAALIGPTLGVVVALLSWLFLYKIGYLLKYQFSFSRSFAKIKNSSTLSIGSIISGTSQNTPTLLVSYYLSLEQTAAFGLIERIRQAYPILMKSISHVLFVQLSGTFDNKIEGFRKFKKVTFWYVLANLGILAILVSLFSALPVKFFAGVESIKDYFPFLALTIFVTCVGSLLGVQWFGSRGENTIILKSVAIGLVVLVISGLFLIPSNGVFMAMIVTLISEITIVLVYLHYLYRSLSKSSGSQN